MDAHLHIIQNLSQLIHIPFLCNEPNAFELYCNILIIDFHNKFYPIFDQSFSHLIQSPVRGIPIEGFYVILRAFLCNFVLFGYYFRSDSVSQINRKSAHYRFDALKLVDAKLFLIWLRKKLSHTGSTFPTQFDDILQKTEVSLCVGALEQNLVEKTLPV